MAENNMSRDKLVRRFGHLLLIGLVALMVSAVFGQGVMADTGASSVAERIMPVGRVHIEGQPFVETESSVSAEAEVIEPRVAPRPSRGDYPNIGVSSRAVVWILAQLHLFFGALVLAVPLFVLVLELASVITGDERYDDMAHEFMKISLTGFSITAIFGGTLALALFVLYPDFMGYMMHVFGAQWIVYAGLFFLESFFLYTYYYGWNAMQIDRIP